MTEDDFDIDHYIAEIYDQELKDDLAFEMGLFWKCLFSIAVVIVVVIVRQMYLI